MAHIKANFMVALHGMAPLTSEASEAEAITDSIMVGIAVAITDSITAGIVVAITDSITVGIVVAIADSTMGGITEIMAKAISPPGY